MTHNVTPVVGADELLIHQVAHSFATVGSSDLSWTEKVWSTVVRRDGGLQAGLGLGKYPNRGVMDGFAGVSRGKEQWTVRASRTLVVDEADRIAVGPLEYEVLEPLRSIRVALAENEIVPVSFDLTLTADLPCAWEDRDVEHRAGRLMSEVARWHQIGRPSGWITIDGERVEVTPDAWYCLRDRSWGIRENVGQAPRDLPPVQHEPISYHWFAGMLAPPTGKAFGIQSYYRTKPSWTHATAHINYADGHQEHIERMDAQLSFADEDRDLLSGIMVAHLADGKERSFELSPLGDQTGLRLWPAGYIPWKHQRHGTYLGPLHVDGEYIADCPSEYDAIAKPAWQMRDRPVLIREGDAVGYGIIETIQPA
jgi:hypothetical protein